MNHMRDGFIKVAAGVPRCTVADVAANTAEIKTLIDKANAQKINLLALPELCITAYTCGDLFFSQALLAAAESALAEICEYYYNSRRSSFVPLKTLQLRRRFAGRQNSRHCSQNLYAELCRVLRAAAVFFGQRG